MEKYYEVGYKKPAWKYHPHDILLKKFKTKALANVRRKELKDLGCIQTFVKLKKGERALSDY